jgi:large-conductance mechanosensitive channel
MSTKSPERSSQQPLLTAIPSSTNEDKQEKPQEKAKERSGGAFGWWYRLTAPDIPPPNAPFAQLEIVRRGRLASIILFFVLLLGILAAPSIIVSSTDLAAPLSHLASIAINVIALFFNRRGKVTIAGILVVTSVTLGFTVSLVFPGHIGVSSLPLFELLALPELIAVSLLPPGSVFIVALLYSLFVWFDLSFLPHARDLEQLLAQFRYGLILEPILLYVLVAVVTFLWVRGAIQALKRADRAEEIAILERREVERQQQEIEQKRQLDLGIQQILQTHVQVANGNFQVRAPLTRENILWQIAYSLNNLVARLQNYAQGEMELRRVREQAGHLLQAVRQAKDNDHPIWVKREGTFLDPIALELNGLYPDSPRNTPNSRWHQRMKKSGD